MKIKTINLHQSKWQSYKESQFSAVQSLSRVRLFVTPRTSGHKASLSITNSQTLLKLMSIESVMPSNHLILCCPLLLLPSIFPSIRGFTNESVLRIRWPKYWIFNFSISPSNEYSELISFRIDWFDRFAVKIKRFFLISKDRRFVLQLQNNREVTCLFWC